jgi:SAM-dependent methyltransferase
MKDFTYLGTELEIFAQAKNWKNYVKFLLNKFVKGDVLEVGAGIGSNTILLHRCQYNSWFCLEPDNQLFQALEKLIDSSNIPNCLTHNGTIDSLGNHKLFDSILYIDVLEHIENDREEARKAYQHLKSNGNLIILVPAHQWLFTPFDKAIGHYRRYNKVTLEAILPEDIEVVKMIYLDSVGLLASLANKMFLKQSQPTLKQIKLWDNLMVPLSKKLDPVLGHTLGKSLLLIGKKN